MLLAHTGDTAGIDVGAILPETAYIAPYLQKLHLMRVADIPYLNLDSPDCIICHIYATMTTLLNVYS